MIRWELPEGWEWTTLGEIANVTGGLMKGRRRDPDEQLRSVPYLRVANVQRGYLDLSEMKTIEATEEEIHALRLQPGDILFNEGGDRDQLGRGWVWQGELPECIHQNHVFRARLRSPEVSPHLVSMWGNSYGQAYFIEAGSQTTNLASISMKNLRGLPIPLPPLDEQTRIITRLNALQSRITTARAGLDELRQLATALKRAVLDAAFRGELTAAWREAHPDAEPASALLDRLRAERRRRWQEAHPGKPYREARTAARGEVAESTASALEEETLPETWHMARLRDVVTLQAGYAFKSEWYTQGGIRLLRGINIVPGGTRWSDVVELSEAQAADFQEYSLALDDIVIAMDRPLVSGGLKVARLTQEDLPSLLLQRVGRFQRSAAVHCDYLYAYLHSSYFLHQVSGQSTGTQLPHISGNDIEAAPIPLPPLDEQIQIGSIVQHLFQTIAALHQSIEHSEADLTTTERALLTAAFRGELLPPADP